MWLAAAAAWGLAEATLFFIVPDVLLSWLAAFRPRVAWPAVLTCLVGALAGGVIMYLAAADAPKPVPLFNGKDLAGWGFHLVDPSAKLGDV